ncbi:MAG: amidohydrolase family protein [Rectinemataceae bacterium]
MNQILVQGSRLFDPASGLNEVGDILIEEGRIAALGKVNAGPEATVIRAQGLLALPGFIDIHAHALSGLIPLCADPDAAGVHSGVTLVCDAGSAGWANLDEAAELLSRRKAAGKLSAFVHLAPEGEKYLPEQGYERWDGKAARSALGRHSDLVVGIKVRAVEAALLCKGIDVLATAAELAHDLGLPLMVHVGDKGCAALSVDDMYAQTTRILGLLHRGDILTHAYTPFAGGLFRDGNPIPGLEAAIARGVLLDAAPGRGQFSFPLARRAIMRGFKPQLAGTDTVALPDPQPHFYCVATVISKFLALGLSLAEVVALATGNAARALGKAESAGALAVGRDADITLVRLERGLFVFTDGGPGNLRMGTELLRPVATIAGGRRYDISEAIAGHRVDPVAAFRQMREKKKAATKR